MFQSEHLVEKWAPLLEHEGCESIKDNHRKAVTAVLLENQEKFLKEQNAFAQSGSFLSEQPTNAVGNGGFTGGAADAGPVAGFDPVLISLIRRSMPNLSLMTWTRSVLCLVLLDSSSRCVLSTTIKPIAEPSSTK